MKEIYENVDFFLLHQTLTLVPLAFHIKTMFMIPKNETRSKDIDPFTNIFSRYRGNKLLNKNDGNDGYCFSPDLDHRRHLDFLVTIKSI